MNGTERAYAAHLEMQKQAGLIYSYAFEAIRLRLAKSTFYNPDFVVYKRDGTVEFHEVKGYWRDDARVKIKVAAELFPFRFLAVVKRANGWDFEDFG